jgi:hypothetical protein
MVAQAPAFVNRRVKDGYPITAEIGKVRVADDEGGGYQAETTHAQDRNWFAN